MAFLDRVPIAQSLLYDKDGNAVTVSLDAGIRRIEIAGKVTIVGSSPPPATTPAVIIGDTPLVVGSDDTSFVIPDGETFHLQQLTAGNEDPTKGAVITLLFDNGTEHVIERIYVSGSSVSIGFGDVTLARDGTALLGDGVDTIVLRREKFSGTNIAIDSVARGYTV